ncbi:Peptide synthetase [Minicystis rosea]|nr:Peptide synthetase [Minicystis rosea]
MKIRGHRIELGEIEAALARAPGVRQAVVTAHEAGPMDLRLVAHVVPHGAALPTAEELRAVLAAELPAIMVPPVFVMMDALPSSPAGKVDRRALAALRADVETKSVVMPRDEEEVRIAAIWRELLGIDRFGVTDGFFELGGHSLLAVRMIEEINRTFGTRIEPAALVASRTIEALARLVRRGDLDDAEWPAIVPMRPNGKRRPLFLVAPPNVDASRFLSLASALDPDQPVYALQARYPEEAKLGRPYTLEERRSWSTRYLTLMKAMQPEGPYLVAGMCEGALVAFDMVRRLEDEGQRVGFFGVFDAWPEENTSVRFWHRVFVHERALRAAWGEGPDELLRYVRARAGDVVRSVIARVHAEGSSAPIGVEGGAWDVRLWPGPSFVPPRVEAHIDVFRTRTRDYFRIDDPELGWGNRTAGGVDIHFIGGDHMTFMDAEHAPVLSRKVRDVLDAAHEQMAADAVRPCARVPQEHGAKAPSMAAKRAAARAS